MKDSQMYFVGRDKQLRDINTTIDKKNQSFLISVQGQGGIGKTYLLRRIRWDYEDRDQYTCFPLVDFSQNKTRSRRWLMETIASYASSNFDNYHTKVRELRLHEESNMPTFLGEEDLERAFFKDLLQFEKETRCIFLFDTLELIQDTLLIDFILRIGKSVQNSVIILAGRRNQDLLPDIREELRKSNCKLFELRLKGFERENALEYMRNHPGSKLLNEDHMNVLYLLSENGIPIKLALALDWLCRGWVMNVLADHSYDELQGLRGQDPRAYEKIIREFEHILVTQIGELGTYIDQIICVMAYVYKRFNRALLRLLIRDTKTGEPLTDDQIDALLKDIQALPFVKCIEDDYYVLHDEVQRMVLRHIWEWRDPSYEERREIGQNVINYYSEEIRKLRSQESMPIGGEWTYRIYEIEKLHYQLDVDLIKGYKQFSKLFEELKDRRSVEMTALALDVIAAGRALPNRLRAFINTYHRGWILVRREQLERARELIEDGLREIEIATESENHTEEKSEFIKLEVDRRTGEIYTLLGYCYRLLGNWDSAIENYELACERNKNLIKTLKNDDISETDQILRSIGWLAETLNDIANLQRMQGNLSEARRYCKMSLIIRERLQARRSMGHCCYVMGMILWEFGNTSEAMNYLERARSYYQEQGTELLESAWIDRYEGHIMLLTGNRDRALTLLQKALGATTDQMGLQDEYAEILLHLSRIDRETSSDFDLALKKAETALSVARKIGNDYRIAECCYTLAITLFEMMKPDFSDPDSLRLFRAYLQEGLKIAQVRKYGRLEVVFVQLTADLNFFSQNYIQAFNGYTLACRKAADFKPAVFVRNLSKLVNHLHQLIDKDSKKVLTICDRILHEWSEWPQLDEKYPELRREICFIREMAQSIDESHSLEREFENEFRYGSWAKALQVCDRADEILIYNHPHQASVHHHRAEVYHSENNFLLAFLSCERAIRIRQMYNIEPKLLGDSYLLLAQIFWKLGNTQESAQRLQLAEEQYEMSDSAVGKASIKLEWAYVYFRTHQFVRATQALAEAQKMLRKLDEPILLASTLNLMGRLSRIDPCHDDHKEIGFEEAHRRGEEALQVLGDRDWFAEAEINLTLCILHYRWGVRLNQRAEKEEAAKHFRLAKEYNHAGWDKIEQINTPMLYSVYRGMQGNLFLQTGEVDKAKLHFIDELIYATQTKHMRLFRALDLLENWLSSQPLGVAEELAEWFIAKWTEQGLADEHPELIKSMEFIIAYRQYIPDGCISNELGRGLETGPARSEDRPQHALAGL